jgi:GNAT superfamily N-acetyltransferase
MPIVRFQPEHREGVLRIHAQTFESLDLASHLWQPCQQIESLEKECPRFICEDATLQGYVAAYRLDDLHFRLNLVVHPDHTGRGIGSLLLDRIQSETEAAGGEYLQARLLESMQSSRAFASSRGFTEVHVMRGMSLHSADFSFARWKPLGPELSARGLLVTTLRAEFEKDNDPVERLARLHQQALQGWASPDPTWGIDMSVESCRSFFTDIRCPEHFSIMKCGSEYVGYTSSRDRMPATAVHPDYRNFGVATYLKAYNISACIDSGQEHFESATANPAMQRVNEKLGYRLNGVSEVRFVKRVRTVSLE